MMFVEAVSDETIQRLEQSGVLTIPVSVGLQDSIFSVNCYRYLLYDELLQQQGKNYEYVLLCDTRDVIFQHNPFDDFHSTALQAYAEDASMTIGTCDFNSAWVREYFGLDALQAIANKEILCSGVTLGTSAIVQQYVAMMRKYLTLDTIKIPRSGGVDQGVHNYLIYNGLFQPCEVHHNEHARVITMSYMKPEHIRVNGFGNIVNADGSEPAIVHQYDRHPFLNELFIQRFGA